MWSSRKDTAAGGVHSISIFALLKNIQKKLFNKNIAISGKDTATATISILQLGACSLEKPLKLKHTLMETSPGKDTATILITNPNQIQPYIVNILICWSIYIRLGRKKHEQVLYCVFVFFLVSDFVIVICLLGSWYCLRSIWRRDKKKFCIVSRQKAIALVPSVLKTNCWTDKNRLLLQNFNPWYFSILIWSDLSWLCFSWNTL